MEGGVAMATYEMARSYSVWDGTFAPDLESGFSPIPLCLIRVPSPGSLSFLLMKHVTGLTLVWSTFTPPW